MLIWVLSTIYIHNKCTHKNGPECLRRLWRVIPPWISVKMCNLVSLIAAWGERPYWSTSVYKTNVSLSPSVSKWNSNIISLACCLVSLLACQNEEYQTVGCEWTELTDTVTRSVLNLKSRLSKKEPRSTTKNLNRSNGKAFKTLTATFSVRWDLSEYCKS